jgi:alkylation response protein AidB-like acyl-CoA dehydrogenase
MDFSTPPELAALLERAKELMESEVYPLESTARESFEAVLPAADSARERIKAAGLWAPQMPTEYGGMGLDFLPHAHMSEILGRSPLGHYIFGCQAPDAGNMEILHKFGTEEQKERWLRPLAAGQIRSCFSMTEPDRAGSNPTWLETTAVRDGDELVINGRKWFTTGGHLADFAIVMAVTCPEAPPHMRASQIIVPADTPGFRHVRRIPIMGDLGYGWQSHSEIAYEDCRVPAENLLGREGLGFLIAQERLGPGRIHHCMRWLGICERAFDLMCERAARREVSPNRLLATQQVIQHWIAESRAEIDSARWMVYHAAWKIDREGTRTARNDISAIKFMVAGVLQRVIDRSIQTHGGLGMTDDTPLAWFFRHERAARIYDGPDEVHKSALARTILKAYGIELGSQGS